MNQESIVFSIIIPLYNSERFIKECLVSVKNQTFSDWEAIIIDDCSEDHSQEVVEHFIQSDSRMYLLKNSTNSGVSYTRNKGIKKSKGKYIALLDSDDKWPTDKLEKQFNYIKNKDFSLCFGKSVLIDEKSNEIKYGNATVRRGGLNNIFHNHFFEAFLHEQTEVPVSSVVFKKELAIKAGLFPVLKDKIQCEDIIFFSVVAQFDDPLFIDDDISYYRMHSTQYIERRKNNNRISALHFFYTTIL